MIKRLHRLVTFHVLRFTSLFLIYFINKGMLKEKQFDGKQPQGYKKKSFIPFNGNFNITSSYSVEETAKQNLFFINDTNSLDAKKMQINKKKIPVGFMPIKKISIVFILYDGNIAMSRVKLFDKRSNRCWDFIIQLSFYIIVVLDLKGMVEIYFDE